MLTERDLVTEPDGCECDHCECWWEDDEPCCICGEGEDYDDLDGEEIDFDDEDEDYFSDLEEDDLEDFD